MTYKSICSLALQTFNFRILELQKIGHETTGLRGFLATQLATGTEIKVTLMKPGKTILLTL